MIERPILFNSPMMQAVLEGRKTVTRRALSEKVLKNIGYGVQLGECHELPSEGPLHPNSVDYYNDFCPFGKPGDRLWPRESFRVSKKYDALPPREIPYDRGVSTYYAAGGSRAKNSDGIYVNEDTICVPDWVGKMRPSIHMPRAASRALLEVVSAKLERLKDITEEQAKAEGCFFTDYGRRCGHGGSGWKEVGDCPAPEAHHPQREGWMWAPTTSPDDCLGSARMAFANLWNSTGGQWDANPWVWAVEFKVVQ